MSLPGGSSLGGARYALTVDLSQFAAGFAQAQATARTESKKISDAINVGGAQLKPIVPKIDTKPAEQQLSRFQGVLRGALRGAITGSGAGGGLLIGAGVSLGVGAAVAVQALTRALIDGASAGVAYNAQLEQATATFKLFTGSASLAEEAVLRLKKNADITPFNTAEVIRAGQVFIQVTNGDIAAMERLVKASEALAATNTGPGGGLEGATIAIRELLGGQVESIAQRFNISRAALTAARDQGQTGIELVQTAIKLAHGSEELVNALGQTFTGRLSTFVSTLEDLRGAATKPIFAELSKELEAVNGVLAESSQSWKDLAGAIGETVVVLGKIATVVGALTVGAPITATIAAVVAARAAGAGAGTGIRGAGRGVAIGAPLIAAPAGAEAALSAEDEENQRRARELTAAQEQGGKLLQQAQREAAARTTAINVQLQEEEAARKAQLAAADAEEKGELKLIQEQFEAKRAANKAAIDDAERARDAEIRAAKDRHEAIGRELDAEVQALQRAREQEDRGLQDTRGSQDRQLADQRSFLDRQIADRRTAEDQAFSDERDAALASLHDQEEARQRTVAAEIQAIRTRTEAAIRGLDEEAEAARSAAQSAIQGLEAEGRAEEDRHRKRIANLNAEEARQLGAIDRQLAAIDTAERKQAEASQDAANKAARERAQRGLAAALRVGDPVGIAAARKVLADANNQIQKEQEQRDRDAQRRRLQAQQDEIRKAFEARKRAADDEARRQQRALDDQKRRIQEELTAKLAAIADQKQAVQDGARAEIQTVQDQDQAAKDAYDAEVKRTTDAFDARQQARDADRLAEDRALADSRLAEDRALAASRQAEDRFLADGRAAQDADIAARRQASDDALQAEQDAINERYNGKTGILTLLRKATEDINVEHQKQLDDVNEKYDRIKAAIQDAWDRAEAGLIAERDHIKATLEQEVEDWSKWKDGTIEQIDKVIEKIKKLVEAITGIPGAEGAGGGVAIDVTGGQALPSGGNLAYGPVVRNADPDSYWTSAGTHGGHPAADIFAPSGSPIYSPVGGSLESYHVSAGGNAATLIGDDGRAYYFAHGKVPFASGAVRRGQQIGQVGNSGNAEFTASHLHFAISEHGAGVFSDYNGSGDVMGDASYWGDGGVGVGSGDGDWIDVVLFGRKYRILIANSTVPGDVGQSIRRALKAAGEPGDWEFPMGEIAAAESGGRRADGSVIMGSGNYTAINPIAINGEHASGLMQMLPSTFRANRVGSLPNDIFDPVANPASASNYIRGRYGSPWATPYFSSGHMDWRGVAGYADGGWITRPTLLSDYQTGETYGIMAEAGPERIVPLGGEGAGVPVSIPVYLDGRQIAQVVDPHLRYIESHDRLLRRR